MEKNKKNPTKKETIDQKPINIITHPDTTKGVYSNVALIHHSEREFVIDFLFQIVDNVQLVSRVIMSPEHMRAFSTAITENISKFEEKEKTKKN